MKFTTTTILLAIASLTTAAPAPENPSTGVQLEARARSGDLTWYHPGLGACGQTHGDNDAVVALPFSFFTAANPNNDPMCKRRIRITYGGKTRDVQVVDKCAGCQGNSIDVSPSVFQGLVGNLDAGRVKCTWDFI